MRSVFVRHEEPALPLLGGAVGRRVDLSDQPGEQPELALHPLLLERLAGRVSKIVANPHGVPDVRSLSVVEWERFLMRIHDTREIRNANERGDCHGVPRVLEHAEIVLVFFW